MVDNLRIRRKLIKKVDVASKQSYVSIRCNITLLLMLESVRHSNETLDGQVITNGGLTTNSGTDVERQRSTQHVLDDTWQATGVCASNIGLYMMSSDYQPIIILECDQHASNS